jgi:hypothetical protein
MVGDFDVMGDQLCATDDAYFSFVLAANSAVLREWIGHYLLESCPTVPKVQSINCKQDLDRVQLLCPKAKGTAANLPAN